ncbi:MAG: hypothetical protein RLZZ387_855 [Chloroflexota bacterium]
MRRFATDRPPRPMARTLRLIVGWSLLILVLPAIAVLLPGAPAALANPTTVSGLVYRDYNDNGVRDAREPGVPGVVVSAFAAPAITAQATTGADGSYTISVPVAAGVGVRVEFEVPSSGFQSAAFGASSGTTAQFVTLPATNVNLGINRPGQYCGLAGDLSLVTSCYVLGNQQASEPVLIDFPYEAGKAPRFANADQPTTHALMVPARAIGTTWGLAYQRSSSTIFAGAFLKRHAGYGPGGPGAIYRINRAAADGAASLYLDLNALFGPGTAGVNTRTDTSDTAYITDGSVFSLIGKAGLGDVEMYEDDKTLYAIALGDRRLYEIPSGGATPPAAASIRRFSMPDPGTTGPNACPLDPATPAGELNLNLRPFGLGVNDGLVYVGMVCTAESTRSAADLRAYVYAFDPAAGTFAAAPALTFSLDYARGCLDKALVNCANVAAARWRPWISSFDQGTFYPGITTESFNAIGPQPWLVGIDFDNGAMIVGLRDRYGEQMGNQAGSTTQIPPPYYLGVGGGDVLRACPTAPGAWAIEGSAGCPVNAQNSQGPLGGEFYFQDDHRFHDEVSLGAVLQVPGFPEAAVSVSDPIFTQGFDGGVRWFSNVGGAQSWVYRVFNSAALPVPQPLFGKTNGLGDMEAMCPPAPVEIGNRVWYDVNQDGIQGPDESPVARVTLQLYSDQGVLLATAVTNERGEYYFRGGPSSGDANPGDHIGLLAGPVGFDTRYQIRIDNPADTQPGGPLFNWYLTFNDRGDNRVRDSNGLWQATTPNTGFVFANVLTQSAGFNNHTFDFGFIQNPTRIRLQSFTADRIDGGVEVAWSTGAEVNTWGFQLYRGTSTNRASAVRVTPQLIPAEGRGRGGATYVWLDRSAQPGVAYTYWLQEVELNGTTTEYGPASAMQTMTTRQRFYLPLLRR